MSFEYTRVSNSEEEWDHDNIEIRQISSNNLQLEENVTKRLSPWTAECVARLIVLFAMFVVGAGFAIHALPSIEGKHGSSHHGNHGHGDHDSHHLSEEHHKVYRVAAVAAGNGLCSSVGVEVLRDGGNAVDAAIATSLCEGVIEPQYSGIGGDFQMTIYNATTNQTVTIDANGVAPASAHPRMFDGFHSSSSVLHFRAQTIALPTQLRGFSMAYSKYGGGVPWRRLFDPAVRLASAGFPVGAQLARDLNESCAWISNSRELCVLFCDATRKSVKREGDIVVNSKLAATLRAVRDRGADEFYSGPLAAHMARTINVAAGSNSVINTSDFLRYRAIATTPIRVALGDRLTLHVPPAPSSGPVLALIVRVVSQLSASVNRTLRWHRTVEAFKHAFGFRSRLADPAFVAHIASPPAVVEVMQKIFDNQTFVDNAYYGSIFRTGDGDALTPVGGSHVSVLAPGGSAVSVTSSLRSKFGSKVLCNVTGVLFNDRMLDFSVFDILASREATNPNLPQGRKRPLSSAAPAIITNDDGAYYIIGASGGRHIPTAVASALIWLLYAGEVADFDDAIREPLLHHQLTPDLLYHELDFDRDIVDALHRIGHRMKKMPPVTHTNAIKNHGSHIHAFSDLRSVEARADGW